MKLKILSLMALSCLSFTIAAHANEVLLRVNQPMKITFKIAHQNQNGQPVFSELQSIDMNKAATIPINLSPYELAGMVIVSVGGHELPPSANQFNQPQQCSMTTDKTHTTGTLAFTLSDHAINCRSEGGIFG